MDQIYCHKEIWACERLNKPTPLMIATKKIWFQKDLFELKNLYRELVDNLDNSSIQNILNFNLLMDCIKLAQIDKNNNSKVCSIINKTCLRYKQDR